MTDKQYRVVMVDDDPEDSFAIARGFTDGKLNIDFRHIQSGEALFDDLGQGPSALPDLILLDINMPRINGFKVLRRLKAEQAWKDIPVFVLSTSSRNADRTKCLGLGATRVVTKFTSMKALDDWIAVIEEVLIQTKTAN